MLRINIFHPIYTSKKNSMIETSSTVHLHSFDIAFEKWTEKNTTSDNSIDGLNYSSNSDDDGNLLKVNEMVEKKKCETSWPNCSCEEPFGKWNTWTW